MLKVFVLNISSRYFSIPECNTHIKQHSSATALHLSTTLSKASSNVNTSRVCFWRGQDDITPVIQLQDQTSFKSMQNRFTAMKQQFPRIYGIGLTIFCGQQCRKNTLKGQARWKTRRWGHEHKMYPKMCVVQLRSTEYSDTITKTVEYTRLTKTNFFSKDY